MKAFAFAGLFAVSLLAHLAETLSAQQVIELVERDSGGLTIHMSNTRAYAPGMVVDGGRSVISFGKFDLLQLDSVKHELRLRPEQARALESAKKDGDKLLRALTRLYWMNPQNEELPDLRDVKNEVDRFLDEQTVATLDNRQQKRLGELHAQMSLRTRGARALVDLPFSDTLSLTDVQTRSLKFFHRAADQATKKRLWDSRSRQMFSALEDVLPAKSLADLRRQLGKPFLFQPDRLALPGFERLPSDLLALLSRADVQKELRLQSQQIKELPALSAELRKIMFAQSRINKEVNQNRAEFVRLVREELTAHREKRLSQILRLDQRRRLYELQKRAILRNTGIHTLLTKPTLFSMELTEKQRKQLRRHGKELSEKRKSEIAAARAGMLDTIIKKVLSERQNNRLQGLLGAPFKFQVYQRPQIFSGVLH